MSLNLQTAGLILKEPSIFGIPSSSTSREVMQIICWMINLTFSKDSLRRNEIKRVRVNVRVMRLAISAKYGS